MQRRGKTEKKRGKLFDSNNLPSFSFSVFPFEKEQYLVFGGEEEPKRKVSKHSEKKAIWYVGMRRRRKQDKVNYAVSEREDRVTGSVSLPRMAGCNGMYWASTML